LPVGALRTPTQGRLFPCCQRKREWVSPKRANLEPYQRRTETEHLISHTHARHIHLPAPSRNERAPYPMPVRPGRPRCDSHSNRAPATIGATAGTSAAATVSSTTGTDTQRAEVTAHRQPAPSQPATQRAQPPRPHRQQRRLHPQRRGGTAVHSYSHGPQPPPPPPSRTRPAAPSCAWSGAPRTAPHACAWRGGGCRGAS